MSDKKEIGEVKSEDKKDIEMEEREKMLNAENEAHNKETTQEKTDEKKVTEMKDGMEVKPKKIPIGGIQMPGFFTRSKSKERCKEEDSVEVEVDLIEKSTESNDTSTTQTKVKLPNPFRKSKTEEDGDKSTEQKERKKLLNAIRLPLVSVFPKKKKDDNLENQAQAGLASMETLDDKSTGEKSTEEKNMKNVALDDKTDVENQGGDKDVPLTLKLKDYKVAIGLTILFIITVIIIAVMVFSGKTTEKSRPLRDGKFMVTHTGCGQIEGTLEDGAYTFKGIPYARPPVGDLRFKYAQQLDSLQYCWNGTLPAHNATPPCLQILGNGTVVGREDCLTLDVVTPSVTYDNPVPVVVLIGADSLMGGSPGRMMPSAGVAKAKEVVFVRPNFRLGALGFLALRALSDSDYPKTSGNYGLSDILAALKWVQLNIEHFGGDKNSVTVFGHKAGATLVAALSSTKDAKKYFSRAWASSGGASYPKKPVAEAETENQSFMESVQCEDAACLRSLDAEKLVTAVEDTWRKQQADLPVGDEKPEGRHEWLVLDGRILREYPEDVWSREEGLAVPLVLGTTAQSGATEKLLMKHTQWTEDLVKDHISRSLLSSKNLTESTLKMYPANYSGLSSLISDIRIVCPLFSLSNRMPKVPFYVVTQPRAGLGYADADFDVDVILGNYKMARPEESVYVSAMQGLFYDFVFRGVVNQEMTGQKVLLVGNGVVPNSTYSHCNFWILKNVVPLFAALD